METGKTGEKMAENFLKKEGFEILERNYRTKIGEIDLICRESNTVVFIEVKTRKSFDFGLPEEAVNYRKRLKINKVAKIYIKNLENMQKNDVEQFDYRFDVVSIVLNSKDNGVISIEVIKNAF